MKNVINKPENDNMTCVSYRRGCSKHVSQCAWLPIYKHKTIQTTLPKTKLYIRRTKAN